MPRVIQTAFAGGEFSPSLYARVDIEKFLVGLSLARNFYVLRHGGLTNRPGTQYICPVPRHGVRSRLIEFEFNTEQTYLLVLGDGRLWFVKEDGVILESSLDVLSISSASPGVVTTLSAHNMTAGDTVYFSDITGMTELNSNFYVVTAPVTSTTFTLTDEDGVAVDTTAFGAYGGSGSVSRVYEVATPWAEADLPRLTYEQSADVITFCHPDYSMRELTRTGHTAWTLSTVSFGTGISTPTGVTATGTAGGDYVVTAVSATGEESLPSTPDEGAAASTITWTQVAEASHYRVYRDTNDSGIFGFIGIAAQAASPRFVTPSGGITPDYLDAAPSSGTPFTGASQDPGVSTFYQERRIVGNTNAQPTTFSLSQTGSYNNYNKSEPLKDDDAAEFTLASRKVNEIRHFVTLNELVVLTSGAEWVIRGQGDGNIITPTQPPNAKPQSYNGSSYVRPLVVNQTVLYVQRQGSIVRDLGYRLETDAYQGDDLTVLSEHLFRDHTINEWAYAKTPDSVIWCIRSDGAMLALTYLREHDVFAWTQHATDGSDTYESVASIPETDSDRVYVIARRKIQGQWRRYVEKLGSNLFVRPRDAFYVDSGLTYDVPLTITNVTLANPARVTLSTAGHGISNGDIISIEDIEGMTELNDSRYIAKNVSGAQLDLYDFADPAGAIDSTGYEAYESGGTLRLHVSSLSGLWHLEGRTVSMLGDGAVLAQRTVTNGAVTLSSSAGVVHVGLPILSEARTLPLELSLRDSATAFGRPRTITHLTLLFDRSAGGWVGPSETALVQVVRRTTEPWGSPTTLLTGEHSMAIVSDWANRGQLYLRQVDPLPFTLLAVVPSVEVGDG